MNVSVSVCKCTYNVINMIKYRVKKIEGKLWNPQSKNRQKKSRKQGEKCEWPCRPEFQCKNGGGQGSTGPHNSWRVGEWVSIMCCELWARSVSGNEETSFVHSLVHNTISCTSTHSRNGRIHRRFEVPRGQGLLHHHAGHRGGQGGRLRQLLLQLCIPVPSEADGEQHSCTQSLDVFQNLSTDWLSDMCCVVCSWWTMCACVRTTRPSWATRTCSRIRSFWMWALVVASSLSGLRRPEPPKSTPLSSLMSPSMPE